MIHVGHSRNVFSTTFTHTLNTTSSVDDWKTWTCMQDMTQLLPPFPQTFQTEKELGNVNLRGFLGKDAFFKGEHVTFFIKALWKSFVNSLLNDSRNTWSFPSPSLCLCSSEWTKRGSLPSRSWFRGFCLYQMSYGQKAALFTHLLFPCGRALSKLHTVSYSA